MMIREFTDLFLGLGSSESEENCIQPEDWLDEDNDDPGYQILTDDEIVS